MDFICSHLHSAMTTLNWLCKSQFKITQLCKKFSFVITGPSLRFLLYFGNLLLSSSKCVVSGLMALLQVIHHVCSLILCCVLHVAVLPSSSHTNMAGSLAFWVALARSVMISDSTGQPALNLSGISLPDWDGADFGPFDLPPPPNVRLWNHCLSNSMLVWI